MQGQSEQGFAEWAQPHQPQTREETRGKKERKKRWSRITCANNLVLKSLAPGCKAKAQWQHREADVGSCSVSALPEASKEGKNFLALTAAQGVSQTSHHCWEQDNSRMAMLKEKTKTTNKTKKKTPLNAPLSCFTMNFKIDLEELWQEAEIKQIITVWEHNFSDLPSAPRS